MPDDSVYQEQRYRKERDFFCCLICGYPTVSEPGDFCICPLCRWENDGYRDLDEISGPNGDYTVREARVNFRIYLTVYRPKHREGFASAVSQNHLKRVYMALIDAYRVEQFVRAPDDTTKASKLWEQAQLALRLLL